VASTQNDIVVLAAKAFLEEFGLDCGIRLEEVASRLGLHVQEVEATSFDGALVRITGSPIGTVAIRNDIPEVGRKRFTLAHEIGHYILPNQQADIPTPCRPFAIESWDSSLSSPEIDANRFAAEILLPRELLRDELKHQPTLDTARRVASRFGTSLTAATFRLVELSTYRIAMVISSEGKARWYRPSDEFGRAVRTGPLDRRTLAHDLFAGNVSTVSACVPADAWLFEHNLREGASIWEHSIFLRSYDQVLTLLELRERVEVTTDYDEDEGEDLDPEDFTLSRKRWPR